MTNQPDPAPQRERLDLDAARVLAVLPRMGKLMIASSFGGATHERIGTVEAVADESGWVQLSGDAHDSSVEKDAVASIFVDRSGRMGDKAFPRIDFQDATGVVIFSIVGFEGLEPFDEALAPLGAGAPIDPAPLESVGERGEVADNDPGAEPFEAALTSGAETVVGFRRPGFEQRWRGMIEAVKPAMGFINVMRPDFHLHLKAGSVARWKLDGAELLAQAADGTGIGLFVMQANGQAGTNT